MDDARELGKVASKRRGMLQEWPHLHLARVETKQGEVKLLLLCYVVRENCFSMSM
jgi:hypothetical protein